MHTVGVLDPSDARTAAAKAEIRKQTMTMPPRRIFALDTKVLARASQLSESSAASNGIGDDNLRSLKGGVLFLQAQKLDLVVLTTNVGDYDTIPTGRAPIYYLN